MQTTESKRFIAYIEATTRPDAWEKRRQMLSALEGHTCTSVNALVETVSGNSRDKAWVSQAMAAGEIERAPEGHLRLPNARGGAGCSSKAGEALDAILDACYLDGHDSRAEFMVDRVKELWHAYNNGRIG